MYKYEYETIETNLSGWGFVSGNKYETHDYKMIIEKRASEGWRFVTAIPLSQRGTGHIEKMDLVFEKEEEE